MRTGIIARWCAHDPMRRERRRGNTQLYLFKATRGAKKNGFRVMLTLGSVNIEMSKTDALNLANMLVDLVESGTIEAVE